MATRSLRNRMSSRFSSPAITVDKEPSEPPAEPEARSNDDGDDSEWREPPVRTLPPSYKDHKGLERLGVLELQQPLGVPPSQKLLQRLKLTFNRPSNRGTPLPEDEVTSQEVDSEAAEVGSPMDADLPVEVEETDNVAASSPPRGRPSNRDAAEMRTGMPVEATPSPVKSTFSTDVQSTGGFKPTSIQEHLRQERVQNYVSRAVTEAQEHGDWGLVPGLEKIRQNANDKRELWIVLEAIAHQAPTPEQLHVFKKFIKRGMRRHRRDSARSSSAMSMGMMGDGLGGHEGYGRASLQGDAPSTYTSPYRTRPSSSSHAQQTLASGSQPASPSSRRGKMQHADSHKASGKSPRKRRSRSNSSSSSLSSAKSLPADHAPPELRDDEAGGDERGVRSGRRQAGERHSAAPGPRSARLANNSSSINTTDHTSTFHTTATKIISDKLKKSQQAREEAEQEQADIEKRRKRLLKESEVDYNYIPRPVVNERHRLPAFLDDTYPANGSGDYDYPRPPVVHPQPAKVWRFPTLRIGTRAGERNLMNGTSRKRAYEEIDEDDDDSDVLTPLSSSPVPPFVPPPPPGAERSRAATPRASTRNQGPIAKVARKSARVLVSPNKPKNGGITAGFTRAGPRRVAELGNGPDSDQEDNDEFCASCGGEGKLLCCDGCTNSFHHACLEPPLDPEEEVIGEWFCPQCQAKRVKDTEDSKAIFGKAFRALEHVIPRAFSLPEGIREYFEGVRTGEEGEYTEFGQPRTQNAPKMNRAGFIEEPNYKEPRDPKGKLNLCKGCGLGANGKDLVPCDYCDAKWHLDCVDPPLPIPPRRRAGDKPNASWRCPLHIEQDLVGLGRQAEAAPGDLGGQPRLRKPKNAKPVDVDFPRGFRNNGVIDVELSKDGPSIRELDMHGSIFRLPEQAIRLDFIDRVKKSWFEDQTFPDTVNGRRPRRFVKRDYRPDDAVVLHTPTQTVITIKEPEFYKGSTALSIVETAKANAALRRKTLPEQQAILNLTTMAHSEQGSVPGDSLAELTNTLIAEVPEAAEQMLVRDERAQLQRLQSLVERRLRILDGRDGVVPSQETNRYFAAGNKIGSGGRRNTGSGSNSSAPRGLRELQPAPPGPTTPHLMPHYNSLDSNGGLVNGQYPGPPSQSPYAGPPPPQQAYPFPPTNMFTQWHSQPFQGASSPVKSPYAPPNQFVPAQGQTSPQMGVPTPQNVTAKPSTPGQSLLQNMQPFYGPSPPPLTAASSMQREPSAASASGASNRSGAGSRRDSGVNVTNTLPTSAAAMEVDRASPMVNGNNDAMLDPALFRDAPVETTTVDGPPEHDDDDDSGLGQGHRDEDVEMADDEDDGSVPPTPREREPEADTEIGPPGAAELRLEPEPEPAREPSQPAVVQAQPTDERSPFRPPTPSDESSPFRVENLDV